MKPLNIPSARALRSMTINLTGHYWLNTNTGKTSNHRYTVSAATALRAAAAGYVPEGIQFCVNFFTDVRP